MRNRSGPPVTGEDFLFRDREVAFVEGALLEGNSVLLFGLRRIGKSSLLKEVKERIEADGRAHCAYLDIQGKASASQLFLEILNALPTDAHRALAAWLGKAKALPSGLWNAIQRRVRKGSFGGASLELDNNIIDYWQPLAEAVEQTVTKLDKPVILLIDELPFFIENLLERNQPVAVIQQILATLRAWRNAGIAMAIAGSISVDQLLEDLGISTLVLNDVARLELPPLGRPEATELLRRLGAAQGLTSWSDETISMILDRLDDWFPFFIQCAFSHLKQEDRSDAAYLDQVFARHIQPELQRSFFGQFDERLEKRFAADERHSAEMVLNALARSTAGRLTLTEIDRTLATTTVDRNRLLRRLAIQEFIRPTAGSTDQELPFRLIRRWRRARGA